MVVSRTENGDPARDSSQILAGRQGILGRSKPPGIELGLVETSGVALNYGRQETVTLLTLGVLRCLERARRAFYLPANVWGDFCSDGESK